MFHCLIYQLSMAFKADRRSVSSYLSWGAIRGRKLVFWRIGGGWMWQWQEPEECLSWLEMLNAHRSTRTWQAWSIGSKKMDTSQVLRNSEETQISGSVKAQATRSSTKRYQPKSKHQTSKQKRSKRRKQSKNKKTKTANKSQTNKNSMASNNNKLWRNTIKRSSAKWQENSLSTT